MRLLHVLAKHALLMFIPFWIYHDLPDILYGERNSSLDGWVIGGLLFVDGLCNFLQNVVAFTVLSLVTPLTYSVCNASKRIAVITCSILMLKNPVTPFNIFGMSLAIFGVFYYNKVSRRNCLLLKVLYFHLQFFVCSKAKIDARKEPILPTKSTASIEKDDYNKMKMNGIRRPQSSETNLLFRYVDSKDHHFANTIVAPKSNFSSSSYSSNNYKQYNGYHQRSSKNSRHSTTNGDWKGHTRIDMMTV